MQKVKGFTIVELLIVVVVIGVLAAITVVAYNGVQQRARNSQIISAVTQWVGIIRLYQAEEGRLPNWTSCLGTEYPHGRTGEDASGPQCRSEGNHFRINTNFMNAVGQYAKNMPQPELIFATNSAETIWYRGAYYIGPNPVTARLDFVLAGSGTECPRDIRGASHISRTVDSTNNSVMCAMRLTP